MNKGFTLIELLAVIIILALLSALAGTSVVKIVRDSKSNLYKTQLSSIKSAAMAWGADNPDKLPSNGKCNYITLSDLKEYGLLDESITNPKNTKEFSGDLKIKITSKETIYGNFNIDYEVDSEDIDNCIYITACKLASDSEKKGIELGAKYDCKVASNKEPYTFYVLSNNEDGTTNLIMDRNIYYDSETNTSSVATETNKGLVAWISKEDYKDDSTYGTYGNNTKGPVTAMNYLYNATKDWANIPNIEMNYTDEGNNGDYGYGQILTINNITKITKKDGTAVTVLTDQEGYTNLKARMPYKSEISDYDSTNKTNAYIYDYLNLYNDIQTNSISGIHGYWTLSSKGVSSSLTWRLRYAGTVDVDDAYYNSSSGVRPVITVKL